MFSLIEARNYRCLRYVRQPLRPFQVLVGPNASGKTTFLDVISFLGDLVSGGVDHAVRARTEDYRDLVWGRTEDKFELAVEARIPDELRTSIANPGCDTVRYELAVALVKEMHEHAIFSEKVVLKTGEPFLQEQRELFPEPPTPPATLLTKRVSSPGRTIISKVPGGNDNFNSELHARPGKGWVQSFRVGPKTSALGYLPEDKRFPVSTWFKNLLTAGVQRLVLNSALIKQASPPGQGRGFKPDGSNLPWVVHGLEQEKIRQWVAHIQTALPDIADIRTIEREDDRHRYLVIEYKGGLNVPSWMASDGTLRLLALTLPAYLTDFEGVYLIEEPENGIHPRAVETALQSLSSVYESQVLLATHSPLILSIVKPEEVLCFAKKDGATDIVSGDQHPMLRDWREGDNLGTLFASGVLE
ncbi:MAG: ATP-binding protein [Candidatus Lambdaproteobacteria bacterium]|nr:ATP-binding protein [Candidatus Lambdaproteobacteria bacterium]